MAQWVNGDEISAAKLNENRGFKVGFSAHLSTAQSIPDVTETTILFDTEEFDLGANYDPATGKFTAPVAGYYLVNVLSGMNHTTAGKRAILKLKKNDTTNLLFEYFMIDSNGAYVVKKKFSKEVYLAINDTLKITIEHNIGGAGDAISNSYNNYFEVFLISRE